MAFHRFRTCRAVIILLLFAATAIAGPLNLNVVYPRPEQTIPAVDSTFIFGSVIPGAKVTVNNIPVKVHKGGGWLAYVPVQPGKFSFRVRAEKGDFRDSLTVMVSLPELPRYTFDSLTILPQSLQPAETLVVQVGDEIDLGFDGTPYCHAFAVIKPSGDTVPIVEAPPKTLSRTGSVFDENKTGTGYSADSLAIRGHYIGAYRVPQIPAGPLVISYHLEVSRNRLLQLADSLPKTTFASLSRLADRKIVKTESPSVPVNVMDPTSPTMIEFSDSVTTIRTGPRQGYLAIHQPAGIRAELIGRIGRWLKIRLADDQFGWIPDTAATILPMGTPAIPAVVSYLQTIDRGTFVSVLAATSQEVPFRVEENPAENTLIVFLYGATSNTDWIRYDSRDSLIDHIQWTQPQTGLYSLTIYLKNRLLWGYDAYYDGERFRLDIRKRTVQDTRISRLRFVIDPGHSPDPGAIGPTGLTEKEVNLAIALKLKTELERKGAEVILTHAGTSGIALYDRPKFAVREKADIFVSIHNNALPDGVNPFVNNGVSTYYYHPHSERLARAVQARLARESGLLDFGLYYGNLAVDRPTQFPAILIEGAFMMLPDQEAMLRTEKFQTSLARAIAAGITDFLTEAAESR